MDAAPPLGSKKTRSMKKDVEGQSGSRLFRLAKKEEKKNVPKVEEQPESPLENASTEQKAVMNAVPFQGEGAYLLRPGDTITINLQEIPEAQMIQEELDENGMISLIFIGEIMAAGKTSSELEREIEAKYIEGDFYKRVSASVVVPTKTYTIRGEVNQSGRFMITGRTTLLQAVAAAGGFNEFANPKKITIFRGSEIIRKNFKEIEKNPESDLEIQSEDSIFVARSIW